MKTKLEFKHRPADSLDSLVLSQLSYVYRYLVLTTKLSLFTISYWMWKTANIIWCCQLVAVWFYHLWGCELGIQKETLIKYFLTNQIQLDYLYVKSILMLHYKLLIFFSWLFHTYSLFWYIMYMHCIAKGEFCNLSLRGVSIGVDLRQRYFG